MSSTSSTRSPRRGEVIVMCSAITSSPRIVPPPEAYECVDRIASGDSKIRDSTSPTRRPPRAMQMIWLKRKSDSWTLSASRSISLWYWSQVTWRLMRAFSRRCVLVSVDAGQCIGWESRIVSSRSGPVDTIAIGTPVSASMRARYARAFAGSASSVRTPTVLSFQPGSVS